MNPADFIRSYIKKNRKMEKKIFSYWMDDDTVHLIDTIFWSDKNKGVSFYESLVFFSLPKRHFHRRMEQLIYIIIHPNYDYDLLTCL